MPSRDVNAATRLAEASWMRDKRSWFVKQRGSGFEPGSHHFDFRDLVSPASKKSRFE